MLCAVCCVLCAAWHTERARRSTRGRRGIAAAAGVHVPASAPRPPGPGGEKAVHDRRGSPQWPPRGIGSGRVATVGAGGGVYEPARGIEVGDHALGRSWAQTACDDLNAPPAAERYHRKRVPRESSTTGDRAPAPGGGDCGATTLRAALVTTPPAGPSGPRREGERGPVPPSRGCGRHHTRSPLPHGSAGLRGRHDPCDRSAAGAAVALGLRPPDGTAPPAPGMAGVFPPRRGELRAEEG